MKKSLFEGRVVDLWSLVTFILMNSGQPVLFNTRRKRFYKRKSEVYYHHPTKCFLLFEYKCHGYRHRNDGVVTAFGREESIQQLEDLHKKSHLPIPASRY